MNVLLGNVQNSSLRVQRSMAASTNEQGQVPWPMSRMRKSGLRQLHGKYDPTGLLVLGYSVT